MAKGSYIGIPTNFTVTNMIGIVGDFEQGDFKVTSTEKSYLYSSSNHKFGTQSLLFRQANSSQELTYTLRDSNGQMSFPLNNTHTYYFSIWINQATSLSLSFDMYWPIAEPSVMSGATNTALNQWQQQSIVFTRSSFSNGNYPIRIDCNNYPGNNAQMRVDGMMLVDLTATFGAGNEPDKEWCDSNIPFTTSSVTVTRGVARKINKMYIGVNGIARKIKKAYIGINNIARLFFSGGELSYYGTTTELSIKRDQLAGTNIGDYAIFGGGYKYEFPNNLLPNVDAYNKSLTHTTVTNMSVARYSYGASSIGSHALFAGGGTNVRNTVDAYDTSLTRTTPTSLSSSKYKLSAASNNSYALFAGGSSGTGIEYASVDAYDQSLTRTNPTALSKSRQNLAGARVENYILFGGGNDTHGGFYNTVDIYDASLTRTTSTLNSYRGFLAATTIGNYAVFGGGYDSNGYLKNNVDAFDSSLIRTNPSPLSIPRMSLSAASVGDYALFAGGDKSTSSSIDYDSTVDVYDTNLVKTVSTPLSKGRYNMGSATIGNYALFAGGGDQFNQYTYVDVYTA